MTGGAVTFGGTIVKTAWSGRWPNTGPWWVGTYIGLPTGNTNLSGTAVTSIDSSYINGITAGDSYSSGLDSDGWARIWYYTNVYFGITNDGADVYSSVQDSYFNQGGGLQGGYSWSTVPGLCGTVTAVRTIDSVKVSLTAATDNGNSTILSYGASYNKDGAGWSGAQAASTVTGSTFSGLTKGSTYNFRAWATNARGDGAGRAIAATIYIPKVPGVPASITPGTPSGRAVVVTCGIAPIETGGSAVTHYYFEKSLDGTTWDTTTDSVLTRSATFTNLTGGATYYFRCYATNEMGNSLKTTVSGPVFIPSAGQRYDGSVWNKVGTAKRYDSTTSQWVGLTVTKKYTGGAWVDFV